MSEYHRHEWAYTAVPPVIAGRNPVAVQAVLTCLAHHANDQTWETTVSVAVIAAKTKLSVRTVQRALRVLHHEFGLIDPVGGISRGGAAARGEGVRTKWRLRHVENPVTVTGFNPVTVTGLTPSPTTDNPVTEYQATPSPWRGNRRENNQEQHAPLASPSLTARGANNGRADGPQRFDAASAVPRAAPGALAAEPMPAAAEWVECDGCGWVSRPGDPLTHGPNCPKAGTGDQ